MYIFEMSKQQWGNATWYLFHTLAEKLKPEFTSESGELFRQIKLIFHAPIVASMQLRLLMPLMQVA